MDSCETILKRLRKKSGCTGWKGLAHKLGISQQSLSIYKNSGNIPYEYIVALCIKEGFPLNEIFTGHQLNDETLSDREEYILDRYRSDPAIRKIFDDVLEACDANKKNCTSPFEGMGKQSREEAE